MQRRKFEKFLGKAEEEETDWCEENELETVEKLLIGQQDAGEATEAIEIHMTD